MRFPQSKLMVFSKAPIPGQVKTRLAKTIGDVAAAKVHEYLVRHSLSTVSSLNLAPVELWCAPSSRHLFFQQCRDEFDIVLKEQPEGDLGQRMLHAFSSALSDAQSAIVIGTDCPSINAGYLYEAFSRINEKQCTVIGPAEDGGYVSLGISQLNPDLFENISWGSELVFEQTCGKVVGETELLSLLWDVDDEKDLIRLRQQMVELQLEDDFKAFLETRDESLN